MPFMPCRTTNIHTIALTAAASAVPFSSGVRYPGLMKYWLLAFALIAICSVAFLRWLVPSFIFQPMKEMTGTPADAGLAYEDVRLQTPDGESLAAWYIPAAPEASGPGKGLTLLLLHGNAGNISHRVQSVAFFHKLGLSVFIIDYRGYGESTGKPSVSGSILDARAAWQWLTEHEGVPPASILLFGRSLGGGVAAALAAQVEPKALILESTFTSLYDVGKTICPWLPKFLLSEDYATPDNIEKLRVPLLVVHSPADEVIDYRLGRVVFDGYKGPKSFLRISGSHNRGWVSDLAVYEKGLGDFLQQLHGQE